MSSYKKITAQAVSLICAVTMIGSNPSVMSCMAEEAAGNEEVTENTEIAGIAGSETKQESSDSGIIPVWAWFSDMDNNKPENIVKSITDSQLTSTEYTVPEDAAPTKYGDVNGDSYVNISDVLNLNLFLLNHEKYPLTDTQTANADCFKDNIINICDSTLLLNYVTMIIDESELEKPSNKIQSGICGENCTWKLDEDGLLTISGSGAMENYIDYKNPWADDSDNIKKIVVEEGITEIGRYAFCDLEKVTSIQFPSTLQIIHDRSCMDMFSLLEADIPENVVSIGNYAFYGCKLLNSVNLKEGLKQIGYYAFTSPYGNALQSLYIPSTVDDIGYAAFGFMLQVSDAGGMIRPDKNRTVIGYPGSKAEQYAMEFEFQFKSVDLLKDKGSLPETT